MHNRNTKAYHDFSISLCVVGPVSVGKTSMIKKLDSILRDDDQEINVHPSIMADLTRLEMTVEGKNMKTTITDTPGMKKLFHAIPPSILRNQCGYFVVFDITDRETFTDIRDWFAPIRENCPQFAEIFLLGNKSDMEADRKVRYDEGVNLATAMHAKYFETSAREGSNIKKVFEIMAQNIHKKVSFGTLKPTDKHNGLTPNNCAMDGVTNIGGRERPEKSSNGCCSL